MSAEPIVIGIVGNEPTNETEEPVKEAEGIEREEEDIALLPREVVAELERFIVGQNEAKRAVAIALRMCCV